LLERTVGNINTWREKHRQGTVSKGEAIPNIYPDVKKRRVTEDDEWEGGFL